VQRLRDEAESLRLESHQQPVDYEAVRDRILAGLKVGKQSSEYKRIKAAIDQFINELVERLVTS
jgi:hypothetical protein